MELLILLRRRLKKKTQIEEESRVPSYSRHSDKFRAIEVPFGILYVSYATVTQDHLELSKYCFDLESVKLYSSSNGYI